MCLSFFFLDVLLCFWTCVHAQLLSGVQHFVTPWPIAHQALLPTEFSRRDYWSGLPFSSPGDRSQPETEPMSPVFPAWAGRFFTTEPPEKPI